MPFQPTPIWRQATDHTVGAYDLSGNSPSKVHLQHIELRAHYASRSGKRNEQHGQLWQTHDAGGHPSVGPRSTSIRWFEHNWRTFRLKRGLPAIDIGQYVIHFGVEGPSRGNPAFNLVGIAGLMHGQQCAA